ncbi:hypothetical protein [Taklimakanibacter lacteus]|uniref:hypothetical protein n=1 Tax=Taklimakanibacter lacteus TaxID=2268456 RepID=UPI000E666D37
MSSLWTAGIRLGACLFLLLFVAGDIQAPAEAAKPTHQQAMAACRAKYGKKVTNVIVNKNGTLTCQWQVRREMTRAEAYESCRKKFGPTTIMLQKKKSGWVCRYKPRTSF